MSTCYHEGFFSLDTDKTLFVQVGRDGLEDYDQSSDNWNASKIVKVLDDRAERAKALLSMIAPPFEEVLLLNVLSSPGRSFVTGIAGSMPLTLLLQPDELEAIADVESGDDLALLRYAKASSEVRDSSSVFVFSQLDEYELFRKHGYSYYLSDEGRPTFLSIMPGMGIGFETGCARPSRLALQCSHTKATPTWR